MNASMANQKEISYSRQAVHSLKSKADTKRTLPEKLADSITGKVGTITFLFLNIFVFIVWIVVNLELFLGIESFDPYPFGLLTMLVSLEAIILSIFVLISQNRASKINELRDEVDLQLDILSEKETTKILKMLVLLLEKNGIDMSKDPELTKMLHPTNTSQLERSLEKQMNDK